VHAAVNSSGHPLLLLREPVRLTPPRLFSDAARLLGGVMGTPRVNWCPLHESSATALVAVLTASENTGALVPACRIMWPNACSFGSAAIAARLPSPASRILRRTLYPSEHTVSVQLDPRHPEQWQAEFERFRGEVEQRVGIARDLPIPAGTSPAVSRSLPLPAAGDDQDAGR
jgi:hypothetical protein